ncbi:MAG: hypothetical protein FJW95_14185 [Actinobacteria bacterium]|nr:hypothetical protein [Actinomycetota bacterium]
MMLPTRDPRRPRRPRVLLAVGVLALAVATAACVPAPDPPPPPDVCDAPATSTATAVAVMGPCSRLSVDQIVAWYDGKTRSGTAPLSRAEVPVRDLVALYVEEGKAEGVRGDLAFVQGIIETGWFGFSGRVPPSANNFSGYGATDGTAAYGIFPDARTGVRVQIQHLRAYADPGFACAAPPLANPCVTPRSVYVNPKGKAPTWNQFGGGVWATDPTYSTKILGLYTDLLGKYGLPLA